MENLETVFTWKILLILVVFVSANSSAEGDDNSAGSSQIEQKHRSMPGLLDCQRSNFSVVRAFVAPYAFIERNSVEGPVHDVLFMVKDMCCGSDTRLVTVDTVIMERSVEELMADADIAYPVVKTGGLGTAVGQTDRGYLFLPVIETTGAAIVVSEDASVQNAVIQSLSECWPLALVVLSSAGLAGIIMWVLDHSGNPDDFPQSFIRGGWEGIWWAFVTMTTVGYGDRAPKSLLARMFGLLWMFVGIILMSIFTATLTTALTADQSSVFDMKGAEIGVVKGSKEELVAFKMGAKITGYGKIPRMLADVVSGTIDGAVLDINFAYFKAQELQSKGIVITDTIANPAVMGIILQGQTREVEHCFSKFVSRSQFKAYDYLGKHIPDMKHDDLPKASRATQKVLASMKLVFIVLFCVWFAGTVVCIVWEFCRKGQRKESAGAAKSKVHIWDSGIKTRSSTSNIGHS